MILKYIQQLLQDFPHIVFVRTPFQLAAVQDGLKAMYDEQYTCEFW